MSVFYCFSDEQYRVLCDVIDDVKHERARQHVKWGEQNHPDGTSAERWSIDRDDMRDFCNTASRADCLTYLDILQEEMYEAFASDNKDELEIELIQVAAVAVAWVEKLRRERANGQSVEEEK